MKVEKAKETAARLLDCLQPLRDETTCWRFVESGAAGIATIVNLLRNLFDGEEGREA